MAHQEGYTHPCRYTLLHWWCCTTDQSQRSGRSRCSSRQSQASHFRCTLSIANCSEQLSETACDVDRVYKQRVPRRYACVSVSMSIQHMKIQYLNFNGENSHGQSQIRSVTTHILFITNVPNAHPGGVVIPQRKRAGSWQQYKAPHYNAVQHTVRRSFVLIVFVF